MNIQVAVLCDAATSDNQSKLNLLGAFDSIYASQFPAAHPHCAVALRVTFTSGDEGRHQLVFNVINADGKNIMPAAFPPIPVDVRFPDDTHFATCNFIANFQGLTFPEAGLYSVDVRIDNKSVAGIPLWVKKLPPGPSSHSL